MGFFWNKDLPIEQRIGNLIGERAFFAALVLWFAWADISIFI